ncbi:DUF4349 domain-containing protein [Nocardioides zeicaulis]|uniref:DUF4349 domain-containing protein n=1 Tax=Nocardioides zeicaulis TaxID=1776857 RepID=A0ABV6DZ95_9ACTN
MTTLPTRRRAAGLVAALSMTAALAACSTGASDDADGGASDSAGTSREMGAAGADAASAPSDAGGAKAAAATPALQRAVVSTGAVSLTSTDVGSARRDVQRVVDAQGGQVAEEQTETDEDGTASYARLVVRVPAAAFAPTMAALEDVATLRSSTSGSDDVTTEVLDTGARVRAQEASLRRVELLLADAEDLQDVIAIESQLTRRQADLDSLKSQQAWLRDQTSLSTITVDISTAASAEPRDERPAGFVAGLRGGLDALGAATVGVLTALGALLPFAVVLALLGAPVWLVVRRRRRPA